MKTQKKDKGRYIRTKEVFAEIMAIEAIKREKQEQRDYYFRLLNQ